MTLGLLDSIIATQELVVPRSIPIMLYREKRAERVSGYDLRELSLGSLDDLATLLGLVFLQNCSQHRGWLGVLV